MDDPLGLDQVEHIGIDRILWSSDYPHFEGNAEPIDLYGPDLDDLDAGMREWFMGGNIEQCFARTGDPLPAAATA